MSRESYANLHASQAIEDLLADSRNDSGQQNWLLSYLDVFVLIIMLVITLLAMTDISTPIQQKRSSKKIAQKQIKPVKKKSETIPATSKTTLPKLAVRANKKPESKEPHALKTKNTLPPLIEKQAVKAEKKIPEIKATKQQTANTSQLKSTTQTSKKPVPKELPPHDHKSSSSQLIAKKTIESEQEPPKIKAHQETKKNNGLNKTSATKSKPETEKPPIQEAKKTETKWQDQLKKKLQHFEFVNVKINQGYAQIEIQDNILFDSAKALLTEDGKTLLTKITVLLKQSTGIIFIEGHTDNQPIATQQFPSNWELGSARATSVLHFLTSQDLDSHRLRAVTYADTMPVADNFTEQGRRKNRRVNLLVKIPET